MAVKLRQNAPKMHHVLHFKLLRRHAAKKAGSWGIAYATPTGENACECGKSPCVPFERWQACQDTSGQVYQWDCPAGAGFFFLKKGGGGWEPGILRSSRGEPAH